VTVIAFAENFGYPVLLGDILVTARDSLAEAQTSEEAVYHQRLLGGGAHGRAHCARPLPPGTPSAVPTLRHTLGDRGLPGRLRPAGELWAIGGGARSLVDTFEWMRTTARQPPASLFEGVERIVQALARLLAEEMGNQERTRDEGWGAGYEVLFFAEGRFQKLPSATFAVWHREAKALSPRRLVTYCYDSEDRMVIHSLGARSFVPFVALALDQAGGQVEVKPPNFTADMNAHVYIAHVDGLTYPLAVVFGRSGDRVMTQVVDGKLQILHAQSFEADVRRRLAAMVTAGGARR